jgi:hypothetical protein
VPLQFLTIGSTFVACRTAHFRKSCLLESKMKNGLAFAILGIAMTMVLVTSDAFAGDEENLGNIQANHRNDRRATSHTERKGVCWS